MDFALTSLDLAVVGVYVLGIVLFGLWIGRKQESTDDYFLAGRSLGWGVIGLSLFASNMSTSSLVGMAGEAYGGMGVAVFNYEWMAGIVLVIFCAFFLPFYIKTGIYTLPEFLERRFDGRSRLYFSGWTVFLNITVDTASALYAGSLVIALIYPGVDMRLSIGILALVAGLYTIAGGLKAVVYTDAVQAILLLAGSAAVAWIGWTTIQAQGGWEMVTAVTPEDKLSLILPASDPVMPWPGLLTGVFILGFYFWATNQFMVQRTLAARTLNQGRWGALFAGLLKLPVIFLMVLPGTFARVLYPGLDRADAVFPTMVFDLLPDGLRALVLTAMVAAIMSSVDSTLNSASTLVTMDFVKRFRPAFTSKQLANVGRIVTLVFMVFAADLGADHPAVRHALGLPAELPGLRRAAVRGALRGRRVLAARDLWRRVLEPHGGPRDIRFVVRPRACPGCDLGPVSLHPRHPARRQRPRPRAHEPRAARAGHGADRRRDVDAEPLARGHRGAARARVVAELPHPGRRAHRAHRRRRRPLLVASGARGLLLHHARRSRPAPPLADARRVRRLARGARKLPARVGARRRDLRPGRARLW